MPDFWIQLIVCVFASLGAGLGTGLAGMSAAAVISPMLITFLGVPAYQAIGIALASDVLASLVSAIVYGRSRHLDIRGGLFLLASVVGFTLVGSLASVHVGDNGLGIVSLFMTFLVGVQFVFNPGYYRDIRLRRGNAQYMHSARTLLSGAVIGLICGAVGAGGGMMMLIILTALLRYDLKTAVGTSVFVMSFTAFTGAATHFVVGGVYSWELLMLCVVLTCVFAQLASLFANRSGEILQKRVTGAVLMMLAIGMIVFRLV